MPRTQVVVQANVDGPGLGNLPPQEMRCVAPDEETAIEKIAARAAHQHTDLFGTDDPEEIDVRDSEVIDEFKE